MSDPYKRIARFYDVLVEPLNKGLRGLGMKVHPPKPGKKVLDVCCGTGIHLDLYGEKGCEVYGVDLSPAMLTVARKRLGARASLSQADASSLPYESGTFDLVVCMLALHEMDPDVRRAVVADMKRVVRTDGELLLIDFHPGPFLGMKGRIANIVITIAEFFAGAEHFANSRVFLRNGGLQPVLEAEGLYIRKERIVGGGTLTVIACRKEQDQMHEHSQI